MIKDVVFGGRGIAISERADSNPFFRIAGGPAVWPEIADVKKLGRANGAGGITEIAFATVGMAFAFDEDTVTSGLFFSFEQRQQRLPVHMFRRLDTGGV